MPDFTNDSQITDDVRRRALDYAQAARSQHGDAAFEAVDSILAKDWANQVGGSQADWASVRGIVQEAWNRRIEFKADAVSNNAGFDVPPTFADQGTAVPRNIDEPNQ